MATGAGATKLAQVGTKAAKYGSYGLRAWDTTQNLVHGGRGVADMVENGVTLENSVQVLAAGFATAGDFTGTLRKVQKTASAVDEAAEAASDATAAARKADAAVDSAAAAGRVDMPGGGVASWGAGRHASSPMDIRGAGLVHGSSRFSRLEGFLSQRYGAKVVFDDAVSFGKIDELTGTIRLNPQSATFDVVAHELSHVRFSKAMGKWGTGKALTDFEVNLMESIGYWGTYRKGLASGMSHADALQKASFGPSFAQSAIQALRSGAPAARASLERAVALYGRDYVEQALRFGGLGIKPGKSIPGL